MVSANVSYLCLFLT